MTAGDERSRIGDVVALLTRMAKGELTARGVPSGADDEIDALIVGFNMLAEELEASREELEERVQQRTAQLEQMNQDVMRLTELGNLLQACSEPAEAYQAIQQMAVLIFPGLAGALYLFNASRNQLELKTSWGELSSQTLFERDHCWALRRGQRHFVSGEAGRLICPHTTEQFGDSICIPMAAHGETLGLLHITDHCLPPSRGAALLTETKQQLAIAVAEQTALSLANLQMRAVLRQQALRDPMTGLFNRRFIEDWIMREINRVEHTGSSLGLMMIDIDRFKQFNDVHGHDAGDAVLSAVATTIRDATRAGDVPCRYGGEEFLVLVSDIDHESLLVRAEELVQSVSQTTVRHLGSALPTVTISVGLALYPEHGATPAEVLKKADLALYDAKHRGRNCVAMARSSS